LISFSVSLHRPRPTSISIEEGAGVENFSNADHVVLYARFPVVRALCLLKKPRLSCHKPFQVMLIVDFTIKVGKVGLDQIAFRVRKTNCPQTSFEALLCVVEHTFPPHDPAVCNIFNPKAHRSCHSDKCGRTAATCVYQNWPSWNIGGLRPTTQQWMGMIARHIELGLNYASGIFQPDLPQR